MAGLLAAAGGVLAIAQPGDLGDDDETAAVQETTTTTLDEDTTTSTALVTTTTGADATTTTIPDSGIGGGGTPNGGADGVADTGMDSMLGPGMALGALGLALGRAARRRTA